jgi:tRNA(Ile)-lysidine synthase
VPAAKPEPLPFSSPEIHALFVAVESEPHIALAVSGGSDSLALMQLAKLWAEQAVQPLRLSVLTVDHGLRAQSGAEAAQVAAWASEIGLPHARLLWEGPKPQTGIQAAARDARYRLLIDWCKANGATALLTAHTIEDQAETLIMRLARGTGVEGLGGVRNLSSRDGIRIFRPLISQSRQRLRSFLSHLGRNWIEDPSNDDQRFERIRVRKGWSELEKLGLTVKALDETAHRARRADSALHVVSDEFIAAHVMRHDEGYCEVDLAQFLRLPQELRIRVLDRLIHCYGGGGRPELASLERLEAWFSMSDQQAKRHTLGGAQIALRDKAFLVGREPGRINPLPVPLAGSLFWDHRWQIDGPTLGQGFVVRPAGTVPALPRDKRLPAFVQASLPVVFEGEIPIYMPFSKMLPGGHGLTAAFCPS